MKQMTIRGICFLLFLLTANCLSAQDLWDGTTIASSFHGGSGTADDPYQIRSGAELMYFVNRANDGDDFSGKTVKLMNNIDMNNHDFSITTNFAGTFDGGGHFLKLLLGAGYKNRSYGNYPFHLVTGRIHHLGFMMKIDSQYNGVYYSTIAIIRILQEGGVLEDCYYTVLGGGDPFSYLPTLAYTNNGTIRNCYAGGSFHCYGGYSTTDGSQLVQDNNATGIIENCYASVNGGRTSFGKELPLAYTNQGTIIHNSTNIDELNIWVDEHPVHSRWTADDNYQLVDFNPGATCSIEFVDSLFHTMLTPLAVVRNSTAGQLPIPQADCTFTGWKRYGQYVTSDDQVEDNWTLFAQWEQRIRRQPTATNMSVEVDDAAHASYQWYIICGEEDRLGQWQSTNHGDDSSSSKTFTFQAQAGQSLMFDYTVSSEKDYDEFTVSLNGTIILTKSGYLSDSFNYTIPADGTYSLVLCYSKDDSTDSGDDMVTVTNIRISSPFLQLDCAQDRLPATLVDREGLYFCRITYSNTSTVLNTDPIACSPGSVMEPTDISELTDAIYAEPATGLKGSDGTLTICLKNAQPTNAYSFDLVLPEGVMVESYTLSNRHNGHSETMNRNETTGVYSFAVLSLQSKEITGNDGAIWTLKLNVADDVAVGNYAVRIQNAKYSLTSGSAKVNMPETTSLLTIEDYVKGDVNGDTDIDIADAVCIVNYVVGKSTPAFVLKAADVNGDGDVDIADAVRIVNLIVGKISALARQHVISLPEPE